MSLKDKASKINFNALPSAAPQTNGPARTPPRTAPGQLMELAAVQREDLVVRVSELEAEVVSLKALEDSAERAKQLETELNAAQTELRQWDGAKGTRFIPPEQIVPSPFANRHVLNFSSPKFKQLLDEIRSAGGNVQPVKVRPLAQERDGAGFELVFGHRRHEACRQLGLPVLALVDNVDDHVMFVEMDRENRTRLDLSPWEQGQMYKRGLALNLFTSLRQMAEGIGVNLSAISRAVALAELPEEMVSAFPSPLDLQFRWAKPLTDALEADKPAVLKRAEELRAEKGKHTAAIVFARLVGANSRPEDVDASYEVKFKGKVVGVVKTTAKGVEVRIQRGAVPQARARGLAELVQGFLSQETDDSA